VAARKVGTAQTQGWLATQIDAAGGLAQLYSARAGSRAGSMFPGRAHRRRTGGAPAALFFISRKIVWHRRAAFASLPVLMNPVLKLLLEDGSLAPAQMARVAGISVGQVEQHLEQLKKDKIFLGWRPVLDLSKEAAAAAAVRAVIEVKVTPERGGGFNRLAERIAKFDEVESCYLMSGAYDLLVFVRGGSLQKVASFVSEKLSTIEGVLSTATHFMLRCYKEQGFLLEEPADNHSRLNVSP
jgi:DNA-binding Lrp family transcriptional regulator